MSNAHYYIKIYLSSCKIAKLLFDWPTRQNQELYVSIQIKFQSHFSIFFCFPNWHSIKLLVRRILEIALKNIDIIRPLKQD